MNLGRGKIAVWKGYDGTPHAVSASCTHKGCIVTWNNAVAGRIRRALRLWFIIVSPKTADLPILRCYCTKARLQSEADALAEAKSRVDRVLALNWFAAGKRRYRNHKNLNEAPDRSEPAERASRKVSSHQLHYSLRSTFRSPQRVTPSFSRNTSITFLTASGSALSSISRSSSLKRLAPVVGLSTSPYCSPLPPMLSSKGRLFNPVWRHHPFQDLFQRHRCGSRLSRSAASAGLGILGSVGGWLRQDQTGLREETLYETDSNRFCGLSCADSRSLRGKRI
jgi:hypothetical protein